MSNRLAFQTQLASIMEVLANAAVAEICKLVDDDFALVSLQMSQCQRENKALKRKLHLLELKMARGNAERRLRESVANGGRQRFQLGGDRLRESPCPPGGVFERHVDVTLWSGRAAPHPTRPENIQPKSPDVQLVEPDASLVKEESLEGNLPQAGETEPLLDDGGMHPATRGAAGRSLSLEDHRAHFTPHPHPQTQSQPAQTAFSSIGRGLEKKEEEEEEPDVVLVKVEKVEPVGGATNQTCLSIPEGLVESSTDDCRGMRPPDETPQTPQGQLPPQQDFSEVSYGHALLWTNGGLGESSDPAPLSLLPEGLIGAGGGGRGRAPGGSSEGGLAAEKSALAFEHQLPLMDLKEEFISEQPVGQMPGGLLLGPGPKQAPPPGPRLGPKASAKRVYVCSFCGKRFPAPANLESHRRTHTGERPYGCSICGKRFSQFWNLKIHRNIHTGERPYQCALCPDRFSDPSNLKKHQKRHHPQGAGLLPGPPYGRGGTLQMPNGAGVQKPDPTVPTCDPSPDT